MSQALTTKDQLNAAIEAKMPSLTQWLKTPQQQKAFADSLAEVFGNNAEMQKCSLPSIVTAAANVARWGLRPDPIFKEVYFINYSGVCTAQIGHGAWISKLQKAGYAEDMQVATVYDGEHFTLEDVASKNHPVERLYLVEHKPTIGAGNRLGVIVRFVHKGGKTTTHFIPAPRLEELKAAIKNRGASWNTPAHSHGMYEKLAIVQACKRAVQMIPDNEELAYMASHDDTLATEPDAPKGFEISGTASATIPSAPKPELAPAPPAHDPDATDDMKAKTRKALEKLMADGKCAVVEAKELDKIFQGIRKKSDLTDYWNKAKATPPVEKSVEPNNGG